MKPGILHWHDGEKYQGNSFSSTLTVAEAKGYALVAHTGNLIFVRKDLVNMLDIDDLDLTYPERLFSPERLPDPQPSSLSLFIARKLLSNRFKRFLKRY